MIALRVVALSGALPATVVMPTSSVWRAATTSAMASSCPGSQSTMIGRGVGDISGELATVTLAAMWFEGSGRQRANVRTGRCRCAVSLAIVAGLIVGCSDGGERSLPSGSAGSAAPTSVGSSPAGGGTVGTEAPPPASVEEWPSSTVAPEPTGVPGIDDADPFCAAWAVYSGTVQAIGVANAFGELTSTQVARLEAMAASSVTGALGEIASRWPRELAGERSVVLGDLVGPFGRRAEKAIEALRAAGVTDDELAELVVVWRTALAERNAELPVIAVPPLRNDLNAKVQAAAAAFDAAATPFANDPSLIVESVATPLTNAYLSATCPDLASSGVGDAI